MKKAEAIWVLGAMSGTSLDGVDAAVVETDGHRIAGFGPVGYRAYSDEERGILRAALGLWEGPEVELAGDVVDVAHYEALRGFEGVDLVGLASTAWPFLAGLTAGWIATAALYKEKFDPWLVVPTGVLAWLMWLGLHLIYITGFKSRVTALLHWAVSFIGRGRSERTTTEQQIFARTALGRLKRGAADLVSDPGSYDAARQLLETTRRAELEAQAAEEVRLTDAGQRGVPVEQRVG